MLCGVMRDTQRQRVYNAERETSMWDKDRIDNIHDVREFVGKITRSAWYRRRFKTYSSILVKDGRRCRRAMGGFGVINLPCWTRTRLVILHELSHAVQPPSAWHGREFCKIYLAFVKKWMGVEAYEELKASFKARGVKYVTGNVKV